MFDLSYMLVSLLINVFYLGKEKRGLVTKMGCRMMVCERNKESFENRKKSFEDR